MTLLKFPLDSQPDGTVATAANTGAAFINAAGGTVKFSSAAAHSGSTGLRFTGTAAGSFTVGSWDLDAANTKMAVSVVFAVPELPASDGGILGMYKDAGGANGTFMVTSAGLVVWQSGSYHLPDGGNYTITAGQKYRIAAQADSVAGTITANLYTAGGQTPLATWTMTGLSLGSAAYGSVVVGNTSSVASFVVDVDDIQIADGRTTEIPGLTGQPTSPVHITSVTDNPNGWAANTGTIVEALSDGSQATWVDGTGAMSGKIGYLDDGPVTLIPDADNTGGATSLQIELFQGTTSVASHTWDLSGTLTPYQLSTAENDAISDRSDLNVTVTFS